MTSPSVNVPLMVTVSAPAACGHPCGDCAGAAGPLPRFVHRKTLIPPQHGQARGEYGLALLRFRVGHS